MTVAKIKFGDREIEVSEAVTTLGRASDNEIAFSDDSNVSRYHAEIEFDGDDFWLVDLGSSNGTTVNGERVKNKALLKNEDEIILGGSSKVRFLRAERFRESTQPAIEPAASAAATAADESPEKNSEVAAADANSASKMPVILGCTGAVCGLAFVFVIAAVLFSYCNSVPNDCEAIAKIIAPDDGETLYEPATVELATENAGCVARAIFLINGVEFASASDAPYTAQLDPKQFPELADGSLQIIQIVLEDVKGNRIKQPSEIALNLQTVEIAAPATTATVSESAETTAPEPVEKKNAKISLSETQNLAKKFIGQFSGNAKYNFSNPRLLQEIQKQAAAFDADGYFARAQKYRDVINVAFVQEENLDAPLGFVLALSRSGFELDKQGVSEGLWRMNNDFVTTNSYNALCGTQTLADASQQCAARAAALYLKSLILTVFDGDTLYAVAAFGMSAQEANTWRATLPANRSDFFNAIKNPQQRDQVVRFIVAGIVSENPDKFNLKNERPMSQLYP